MRYVMLYLFIALLVAYTIVSLVAGGDVGDEATPWICGLTLVLAAVPVVVSFRRATTPADEFIGAWDTRWPTRELQRLAPNEAMGCAVRAFDRDGKEGWLIATDSRIWWLVVDKIGRLSSQSTFGYPRNVDVEYVPGGAIFHAGRGKPFRMSVEGADVLAAFLRERRPDTQSRAGAQLAILGRLRAEGILTDLDWERAKDLYLGKQPSEQERAVSELEALHRLHRSGVLSESEFNMKKWDILSRQRG